MASEYKIAIHIAGELEKSFGSSIQGAQQGLASLAGGKILGGIKTMGKVAMTSMMAAGAAVGAAGAYAVNTGRDFEAAMSSTAATAGASAEEYEKLRDAAMEMGRTTSKTATESANALEYMALAGWSVDDSVASLPGILKLSEASGLDLATTSDLVTDSMSAAGVSINQLDKYLDICARAQNKSNQTAEQMMEAYIGVGGVMDNLGVPLQESGAALGVLANRGIKGSEAGTALNAIMTNLTTGTGQAGKMMEELGLSAFDSEGNFIGLEETLQMVNDATKDMSDEERNATLAALGGKVHVKDLNALLAGLNETNEDGVSEWQALQKELVHSRGALDEMRDTKLDNLNGDIATLQSSIQDLGIRAYDSIGGDFRGAVQWATDEVYKLSDAMTEGGFDGFADTLGEVLADAITEIATHAPEMIDAAKTLISSFLDGIDENSDQIGDGAAKTASALIIGLLESIPKMFTTGLVLLKSFLIGIEGELPQILQAGKDSVNDFLDGVGENLPDILDTGVDIIIQLQQGIGQEADNIITKGSQIVGDFMTDLGTRMPELITSGTDMAGNILQGLVNGLPYIIDGGLMLLAGIGTGIIQNLDNIINTGVDIVNSVVDTITNNLSLIIDVGGLLLLELAQGLADHLPDLVESGLAIIGKIAVSIVENLPKLLSYGAKIIGALAIGILRGIGALIKGIPKLLGQIADAFFNIDWMAVGHDMLEGIKAGFIEAWGILVDTVTSLWEDFKAWMGEDSQERIDNYIEGYVQKADNSDQYTSDNGETWHTAQELADMGISGAAEVAQRRAAETSTSEEKLRGASSAATAQKQTEWIKPDSSKYLQDGEDAGESFDKGFINTINESAADDAAHYTEAFGDGLDEAAQNYENTIKSTYGDTEAMIEAGKESGEAFVESTEDAIAEKRAAIKNGAQGFSLNTDEMTQTFMSGLTSEDTTGLGQQAMDNFNNGAYSEAPRLAEVGTEAMEGFSGAMEDGGASSVSAAESTTSQVVSSFDVLSSQLFTSGSNAGQGFYKGLHSKQAAIISLAQSIANSVKNTIDNALKVGSPSRVMMESGMWTGEGFALGLANSEGAIRDAATDAIGGVTGLNSRSGMFASTMGNLNRQTAQADGGSSGSPTITFAPTININGIGVTKQDVDDSMNMSLSKFEKLMKQYTKNQGRLAFG